MTAKIVHTISKPKKPPASRKKMGLLKRFKSSPKFLARFGILVIALNIFVAVFSLSDMVLLAAGVISVSLPTTDDFSWDFSASDAAIVFQADYKIENRGFYPISDINMDATISDSTGVTLVEYQKSGMKIPAFSSGEYTVTAVLPIENLFNLDVYDILFEDTEFVVDVNIRADYIFGLVGFHSSEKIPYTWESPIKSYAEMFLNETLIDTLVDYLPDIQPYVDTLGTYIVSAMMANGEAVEFNAFGYVAAFTLVNGDLDINIHTSGIPYANILHVTIDMPDGGDVVEV